MTRNEMLRFISERLDLATKINECEEQNFTRVKSTVLKEYIDEHLGKTVETPHIKCKTYKEEALKSAVIAFLITLEQKGVLDELLAEIK